MKPSVKLRKQLSDDMVKFFDAKLRTLVIDTARTCQAGGLPLQETISILASSLMKETILAAGALGMDQDDFINFAQIGFERVIKSIREQRKAEQNERATNRTDVDEDDDD
jgi:hypothetical protein